MLARRSAIPVAILASLFLGLAVAGPAHAQWITNGAPVCTATNGQQAPTITADGAGGAIVTWADSRNGDVDIYAQRMNAAGVPQWAVNGVALCTVPNPQNSPTSIPDGAGGAIVTWQDDRSGRVFDIYAQRVNAAGVPQWTTDGVALSAEGRGGDALPMITADGDGGAIVTWMGSRGGIPGIYAQRVDAGGVPQWTAGGVALCTAPYAAYPKIAADGAGGAIVTWTDGRTGTTSYDIYAQRVDAAGVPQWTPDGVALCSAPFNQVYSTIMSDGAGGAIVAWIDIRDNLNDHIYAQRVNSAGEPQWTADGVPLCTAPGDQILRPDYWPATPTIVTDAAGGAIVTWQDTRNSPPSHPISRVYAQRVSSAGAPQWTADGVALCTAVEGQSLPTLIADGAGGAIVTWGDGRGYSIYAQRVSPAGVLQWTADGVPLCTAGVTLPPTIAADGAGGAIVTWEDSRAGADDVNVYAQRITSSGATASVAPAAGAVDAPPRAWPSPFRSRVSIAFSLRATTEVSMEVLDVAGRTVWASPARTLGTGRQSLEWDGREANGVSAGDGVYFLRVRGPGFTASRAVVRVR